MLDVTPFFFFFFNDTATTEIYTLSLHDALPISHLTEKLREHHALGISRETVRRYPEQLGHPPKRARRAPRVRRRRGPRAPRGALVPIDGRPLPRPQGRRPPLVLLRALAHPPSQGPPAPLPPR